MMSVQEGLLTLLCEFDAICREHGIVYYLEGGTLLGAIRHHGFLPWDDDVDLCMTKKNWDKLLSVIDKAMPDNRELFCYERFADYPKDTIKYVNMSTTTIFRDHIMDGLACGQHIDIFILDAVPKNKISVPDYKALKCVYSEIMMRYLVMNPEIDEYRALYKQYARLEKTKGRAYTLGLLRQKLFCYEDTDDNDTYCIRWGNRCIFYEKAFFGEPVDVPFEGHRFYAPQKAIRFLRAEFGDTWMMVPEMDNQDTHFTFQNMTVPCKNVIDDYMPFIPRDTAMKQFRKRKKLNLKKIYPYKRTSEMQALLWAKKAEMAFGHEHRCLPEKLKKALEARQYDTLLAGLKPYVDVQLQKVMIQCRMKVDVGEDVLYAAALALVMNGRYWDTKTLLSLYDLEKLKSSEELKQIGELADAVSLFTLAVTEERFEDADAILHSQPPIWQDQIDFAIYAIQKAAGRVDLPPLIGKAKTLLNRYPHSGEVMKLIGDLYNLSGDFEKSEQWYREAVANTRNGITLLALQKIQK